MATIGVRDGKPAVNVKDDTLWARHREAGPLIEKLGEESVEMVYQGVVMDFWETYAQSIADDFSFGEVWSAGRSGGWLTTDRGGEFLEIIELDDGHAYERQSQILDDLRMQGMCGNCLARVYRGEECTCPEGQGEPIDDSIEDKFDEQQELVVALMGRDKFREFAGRIDQEVDHCGQEFIRRLHEAIEDDEREIVNRAEAAARDIITID